MKELFNRIIVWGADKEIHNIQFETLVQIDFLLEELREVIKEFIAGNTDAAVGEICDLIVYSVNALALLKSEPRPNNDIVIMNDSHHISIIRKINIEIKNIIDSCWFNSGVPASSSYKDLIDVCCKCMRVLGYSPEIALEETIKKIESRRGAMNPITGKWEKFIGQHDIYTPDYSKARINND